MTNSAAPDFRILSDDGADGLTIIDTIATDVKAGPRGPSIGDVWDAAGVEIAIANSGEASDTVSVFQADGTLLGHVKVDAEAGARAWDTLVGRRAHQHRAPSCRSRSTAPTGRAR